MDEPNLWHHLPFPAAGLDDEQAPSAEEPSCESKKDMEEEEAGAQQGPSSCWLEHFTYRDYQLLPCTYVVRPSDMLDAYSSLDSHSDYQGFLETMPLNYPPKKHQGPRLRLTENPEEEELVKMAKRVGLIQHLPTGSYDGCRKNRECVICMMEFSLGEGVRYLPCMHTYHIECINSWLMRSFVCPSCLEPVDAALLTSYETN
ncbi:RING finger protein 11-like [Neocloeon triangulifer]|uniref:RING finger protein 11-like n=1 Tax=Neocloeon triangulifer TaxID=2078957 RepID=UPI00286F39A9|nr:RING finger protein 11-like [Neocloeon triangulifer]